MITTLQYLIVGIIQGITEFLPISSSGHLLIAEHFFNIPQDLVLDTSLHLATLLAVVLFYKNYLWQIITSFIADFAKHKANLNNYSYDAKKGLYIIIATIPAAIAGFLFNDFFESIRDLKIVIIMLFLISFYMALTLVVKHSATAKFNLKNIILIGLAQALALVPGTSRSGITITTGMLLKISKKDAADFSFLLSIPAILGAFALSVFKNPNFSQFTNINVVIAFIAAFISGFFSIKLLLNILQKQGFLPFIIYRIALALILMLVIFT